MHRISYGLALLMNSKMILHIFWNTFSYLYIAPRSVEILSKVGFYVSGKVTYEY